MIFALAALAGIATIGPKFERRQEIVETKFHARERAQGREEQAASRETEIVAGDEIHSHPWKRIFTLGPLLAVIGMIALVAFAAVVRIQKQRLIELRKDRDSPSP